MGAVGRRATVRADLAQGAQAPLATDRSDGNGEVVQLPERPAVGNVEDDDVRWPRLVAVGKRRRRAGAAPVAPLARRRLVSLILADQLELNCNFHSRRSR
jgi:hypothetical protein